MRDYTNTQDKWPEDDSVFDVPLRGSGGWADPKTIRDQLRKPAETWYFKTFGVRCGDHHVHPRGELTRRPGHNFSPGWVDPWILWHPDHVVVLVTVLLDGSVVPEGWLTFAEVRRRRRHVFEPDTIYIEGPYEPMTTFDPTPVPLPLARKRA